MAPRHGWVSEGVSWLPVQICFAHGWLTVGRAKRSLGHYRQCCYSKGQGSHGQPPLREWELREGREDRHTEQQRFGSNYVWELCQLVATLGSSAGKGPDASRMVRGRGAPALAI
jgi:hypothetical protein